MLSYLSRKRYGESQPLSHHRVNQSIYWWELFSHHRSSQKEINRYLQYVSILFEGDGSLEDPLQCTMSSQWQDKSAEFSMSNPDLGGGQSTGTAQATIMIRNLYKHCCYLCHCWLEFAPWWNTPRNSEHKVRRRYLPKHPGQLFLSMIFFAFQVISDLGYNYSRAKYPADGLQRSASVWRLLEIIHWDSKKCLPKLKYF